MLKLASMLRICGYNFDICRLKAAVLQRRETEASFVLYFFGFIT